MSKISKLLQEVDDEIEKWQGRIGFLGALNILAAKELKEKKKQVPTRMVTARQIMSYRSFARGFNEVRKNKPFCYDAYDSHHAWHYERGRQFACAYKGKLKVNKVLCEEAVKFCSDLFSKKILT